MKKKIIGFFALGIAAMMIGCMHMPPEARYVIGSGTAEKVEPQKAGISEYLHATMTPIIWAVELNADGVYGCKSQGYTGYPFLVITNQNDYPMRVLVNGVSVAMLCDDMRYFTHIPPGGSMKVFVEDTATSVTAMIGKMTVKLSPMTRTSNYWVWGFGFNYVFSNISNDYMLAERVDILPQAFIGVYGEAKYHALGKEANKVPALAGYATRK